ncbi:MAG: hypothetical protein JW798_13365 [Prolixibacteraceae bacterium]|nr:hypothetical protein [Prolixibacteraceae bacterium]
MKKILFVIGFSLITILITSCKKEIDHGIEDGFRFYINGEKVEYSSTLMGPVECTWFVYAQDSIFLHVIDGVCLDFESTTSDDRIDLSFKKRVLEKRIYNVSLIPNEKEAIIKLTCNNQEYFAVSGSIEIISLEPTIVGRISFDALQYKDILNYPETNERMIITEGEFNTHRNAYAN